MDREVLFEEFLKECQNREQWSGQGNPNADILIIGKESTDTSMDARIRYIELCMDKKQRDAPRPIDPKNKTWGNYQDLLDIIYCRKSEYIDKWDFEKFAFTTELSIIPRKNSKYSEAKTFIQDRLRFFEKSKFIQDFPVIILACGDYIKNDDKVREIDNTFHVEFSQEYGKKESKNRFWTHVDKNDPRRLVIHTRQLSNGVSCEMIDEMATIIRDHLEHLRKLEYIRFPGSDCYIDESGKVVIPGTFVFTEGLAPVLDENNLKWGFIDETCKVVIPCQWKSVGDFTEGLAAVKDEHDKWGFIDKTGKNVIPCQWKLTWFFLNGLAFVKNEQDKFGFIDKTGKVVIPCQWESVDSFCEGLAAVQDEHEMWGFIDTTGKLVMPCQWKYACAFHEEKAAVRNEQNKYGFINKKGELVIPFQWKEINDYFSEGLVCVLDEQFKWGYIDTTGKLVIPCQWEAASPFREGRAFVINERDRYGFIDKTGKVVIPFQWKDAGLFSEGLAPVQNEYNKWGYIDTTGKMVIPCQWKYAGNFCEGIASVWKRGKCFHIDKTGKIVSM